MNYRLLKHGFSLAEVLMASAILAVGLLLIAGTFPAAIYLSAASVEQTIAPIVVDEAIAKIQFYATDANGVTKLDLTKLSPFTQRDFVQDFTLIMPAGINFSVNEQAYPSVSLGNNSVPGRYNWAVLLRRSAAADNLVQVTVFVTRKTGASQMYLNNVGGTNGLPTPMPISVAAPSGNHVTIAQNYITDGCAIVADVSGAIYRVRDHSGTDVTLDRPWDLSNDGNIGWVVPPAVKVPVATPPVFAGRNPVVGVYQRIIKF